MRTRFLDLANVALSSSGRRTENALRSRPNVAAVLRCLAEKILMAGLSRIDKNSHTLKLGKYFLQYLQALSLQTVD